MALKKLLPNQNRCGAFASPVAPLPPGLTDYLLTLDSTDYGTPAFANTLVVFNIDFSFDGGTTFPYTNSTTMPGGITPRGGIWAMGGTIPTAPTYPTSLRASYDVHDTADVSACANFGVSWDAT